jgi:hypothetical protein
MDSFIAGKKKKINVEKMLVLKPERRDHSEDLGIDMKIILIWV